MDIHIDTEATLERFSAAEIRVKEWCAARGFKRERFYLLVKNQTLKNRNAFIARRVLTALKKEGLLVLAAPAESDASDAHIDHNISCSENK